MKSNLKMQVIGSSHQVPLLNGESVAQIFLDNAASTKPFREVNDFIQEISPYYSNIHRGTGFDSTFCTQRYEEAREIIGNFVGWHPQKDVVIPVRNTTEGLNLIANTINFQPGDRVVTTISEHHSNDLPWRNQAQVDYLSVDRQGRINLAELENLLIQAGGKVKVVCVTGASNVTGTIIPVNQVAAIAHRYHALIVVDGAQLIPHRRFNLKPHHDLRHIDFLVFSGHKMNCPFGIGIVVGRKDLFQKSPPYQVGGGTVQSVSRDRVIWAETPHKQEAGTPNILGMLALARTIQVMEKIGMENIEAHEQQLTASILQGFSLIPQIEVLGLSDPQAVSERVGVISFNVRGVHYALVSAILAYEWGIAVRHGCFCAQPLIKRLLNVTPEQEQELEQRIFQGNRENIPGAVRVSLGIHNTLAEVARLTEAITTIANKQWQGEYRENLVLGEFIPQNYSFNFSRFPGFSPVIEPKKLKQTSVISIKKTVASSFDRWFTYPNQVNRVENRLVALGIVLIAGVAILGQPNADAIAFNQFLLFFYLVYEFLVQVLFGSKFSLLSLLANRLLIPIFNLKPQLSSPHPKRFAQGIGLFLTTTTSILYFGFGLNNWGDALLRCLIIAATLEFAFGFCIGCKIFQILIRLKLISQENCPTCSDSQCLILTNEKP